MARRSGLCMQPLCRGPEGSRRHHDLCVLHNEMTRIVRYYVTVLNFYFINQKIPRIPEIIPIMLWANPNSGFLLSLQ
jgi:hypothetical protein